MTASRADRVAVLGAGAWGTALACAFARNGPVTLWARDPEQAHTIVRDRRNPRALPDVALPASIDATGDLAAALAQADIAVSAVPTQALRDHLANVAPHFAPDSTVLLTAKGLERRSGALVHQIAAETVRNHPVALLSGPSFAADVARGLPTAVSLACADTARAERLVARLATPTLRLYPTADLTGVAFGGAAKNVLAIAAGIVVGRRLGDSARAALTTRGFAEIQRLGSALGARPQTLMGLSGLGDVMLTCTSLLSRNFSFGVALGEGAGADRMTDPAAGRTVEGAWTAAALHALATLHAVDMPITQTVTRILDGQHTIDTAIDALLTRPPALRE